MAVVAVAILISFHLKNEASELEKKVALPFGLIFWFLGIACLISGLNNYIKTVNRYSRRQALVQSGVATQVVSRSVLVMFGQRLIIFAKVFTVVACAIIAACILFLSTNAKSTK